MIIIPQHTIADVLSKQGALFGMAIKQITGQIDALPCVEYIPMSRKGLPSRKIEVRGTESITLGELDILNARTKEDEYFYNVLGVMLGFIRFNRTLSDGKPDWMSGWEVDKESIGELCFIRGFRYFLQLQREIDGIAKVWSKLGSWSRKSNEKRPNRGLVSVCRRYCCLVEGAIRPEDVWNLPWPMVYEAFESCDFDNKEQAKAYEAARKQTSK